MAPVVDALGRPLTSLRLSLTDQCNLRCGYCMPEEHYEWLPRADLLSTEEVISLAAAFAATGADRIRLTGGEPLLRPDVVDVVAGLVEQVGPTDLAMTTNATRLARHANALAEAGLQRVTVSLDTLQPERFLRLSRRPAFEAVLEGIDAAAAAGLRLKVNVVVMRGENDDELVDLIEFGRSRSAEVRFIEYMDVGGATNWTHADVVTKHEILDRLALHLGEITPMPTGDAAPAKRYRLADGTTFGIIASVSEPFCRDCDRSRVTADGTWLRCLYAVAGTDLRTPLRSGASISELAAAISAIWAQRADRGAEERAGRRVRLPLRAEALHADPHLEMHTRGG